MCKRQPTDRHTSSTDCMQAEANLACSSDHRYKHKPSVNACKMQDRSTDRPTYTACKHVQANLPCSSDHICARGNRPTDIQARPTACKATKCASTSQSAMLKRLPKRGSHHGVEIPAPSWNDQHVGKVRLILGLGFRIDDELRGMTCMAVHVLKVHSRTRFFGGRRDRLLHSVLRTASLFATHIFWRIVRPV